MALDTAIHKAKRTRHVTHLPLLAVSPSDISRLDRELAAINDAFLEKSVRKEKSVSKTPRTSELMDQLVALNKLDLLHEDDRRLIEHFLKLIKQKAPVLHMSFSADPSPRFLEKLVAWLRREIHPQVLLTVGLQPTLGAGCILRTVNRQFDFSLREDFAKKRNLLLEELTPGAKKTV